MNTTTALYRRHRVPAEIISHCVWLYFRFCLSYSDLEEMMLVRGVWVTYEAIRQWCQKFGQTFATELRRRRPRPGDKWHLDEVFVKINGQPHYLWRAVDQAGIVLDILMQPHRDKVAAKRFFRKPLKGLQYVPRVLITDKRQSYGAAKAELFPGVEHRQHQGLNNRAEVRLVGQKPNTLGVWRIGPGALRSRLAGLQNLIPVSVEFRPSVVKD